MESKIFLSSPHMGEYELQLVNAAFNSNYVAPLGPHVDAFENEVAEYVGVSGALALSSGTAAIHMALKCLGVGAEDVVFCSSLTFAGSCNPIIYENAVPVFIDSEPESYNMSPIALKKAFDKYPNPKAVIVVNLYGQAADYEKIIEICDSYNVPIIEDAAESLGATYKCKQTGSFGRFGVISFNGNKIITTSGGGMLLSNDTDALKKVKFWSTQARDKSPFYLHSELGYNYRMSNICAAIGLGQMKALNDRVATKKYIFERYTKAFSDIDNIKMYPICDYGNPNYWLSVIELDNSSQIAPADIILALEKENIEARHIWNPMHCQPFYKKYDFFKHNENQSVALNLFNRGVCLPSDTKMTEQDLNRIINVVRKLFV